MAVNGYLFDTNILIDFGERLYPIDIFPSLWDEIETHIESDLILLTNGCLNELSDKVGDPEHDRDNWRDWWISKGFKYDHQNHQVEYSELVNKIMTLEEYNQGHTGIKMRRFLTKADPWLISIAKTQNLAIVTKEEYGRFKIPTICELERVAYITLPNFFRALKVSF